jgi:hypothetical protein
MVDINESFAALNAYMRERLAERLRAQEAETRQDWLDAKCVETGRLQGHTYWVVPGASGLGGLNGYLHFTPRPLQEPHDGGILRWVPVHGGITYWGNHDGGVVYGFDTAHVDSEEAPRHDPKWVVDELRFMLAGIEQAAKVEAAYLLLPDGDAKAALAESVRQVRPGHPIGVSGLIRLLGGGV